MINPDFVNDLIDDAIIQLADNKIDSGVDCLVELAKIFSKAGCEMQSFFNIRKHIIDSAAEKTDAYFIETKVKLAEKQLRNTRNGERKIIIH